MTLRGFDKRSALAFIVAFGIVSLFADAAYEGMRGITGPYLALDLNAATTLRACSTSACDGVNAALIVST